MASASKPSFSFRYSDATYTSIGAEAFVQNATPKELREFRNEYTRMRDAAQKRLNRLGQEFPDSKTYQSHRKGFAKLKDIPKEKLGEAFSELGKFLKAKRSTVSGQKEIKAKTINTFQAQGLNLNATNYDRVIKALEKARTLKRIYGSDEIIDFAMATLDYSEDQFDTLVSRLDDILDNAEQSLPTFEQLAEELSPGELESMDMDEFMDSVGW